MRCASEALLADELLSVVQRGVRVFDLGRPLFAGMPQSPNHQPFRMALQRRHGDMVRPDGGSAANEVIITGGHVGTHIDALSHVSRDGLLHGGVSASDAQTGGRFKTLGIETVDPFVCRGVLLDIPRALGVDACEPGYEVTPDDLAAAADGIEVRSGDVVLIHTGWGARWNDRDAFIGAVSGAPGPGEEGAKWIASLGVRAAGAETIAFEHIPPGAGHAVLPGHRVLLVDHGIHIIETMALGELAAAGVREFVFILSPLKFVGGTGSPVRPLAVVTA
ncbi:MAG: cyclase family protein [Actinomycetota bacterium]|nr:cyclase family protein [Actinomycetota bacterium]